MPKFIKIQLTLSAVVLLAVGIWWLIEPAPKEEVALLFVEAYLEGDMRRCKQLASNETKEHYDFLGELIGFAQQNEPLNTENHLVSPVAVNCELIEDDISVCDVCCDENGKNFKLNLKQEGRAWVVDMSKENVMNTFSNDSTEVVQ